MQLVEVARFFDRAEAYIAEGALKAAGMFAAVRDNGYGTIDFRYSQATGGFGLLVRQDDFQSAHDFLTPLRTSDPAALRWRDHPEVLSGLPLAVIAIIDPLHTGWLVVGARRNPTLLNVSLAVVTVLIALALTASVGLNWL